MHYSNQGEAMGFYSLGVGLCTGEIKGETPNLNPPQYGGLGLGALPPENFRNVTLKSVDFGEMILTAVKSLADN